MRWSILVILLAFMLSGCQAAQTFEKVEDVYNEEQIAEPRKIQLSLPENAVLTMVNDNRKLYFCAGYEISVEIIPAGNLDQTIYTLTGFRKNDLTVMQTVSAVGIRYEWVWTGASEEGDNVSRGVLIDDGIYHYCVCFYCPAEEAGALYETWQDSTNSFLV